MMNQKEQRFRDAVQAYEAKLVGYATFLLHGDVSRAQDVVQDCFFKYWRTDCKVEDTHLAPWLFKVCRNRVYELVRKNSRISFLGEEAELDVPDEQTSCPFIQDDKERLNHCLERLAPRRQELVRQKFFLKLSYKEIAELCGITVNNIGVQLHNAIQSLRKCFEAKEEER